MKWRTWLYRLVPYLGRRAAEEDLQEELRLHLELERERQRDSGVPEADALRAARRTLGNATLIRERTRDVWGWRWLDDLGRDLRHAVRGLRRNPGFAVTVALILALGIGANTAMFSVVYGMLIRPLPYPDAGAIVRISESIGPRPESTMTNASLAPIMEEAESFEQITAYGPATFEWTGADGAVTLRAARMSPSMFPLLRATPHVGRLFTEEEARAGADRVVLLSHGAWTRRFASDLDIVGSVLELDGAPHTVVGVLAEAFFFPSPEEEVWTPYVDPGWSLSSETGPGGRPIFTVSTSFITALGRLRPGVSLEQATTEVRTIVQRRGFFASSLAMSAPQGGRTTGDPPEIDVRVVPLQEEMVRGYRPALLALTAATVLVLLIACVNVAGLLLARGVTRRRALAVCAALGAGRARLVRQLLTESVVLSAAGGVLGLAASALVLGVLPAVVPGNVARLDDVGMGGAGLAFALALSVVVGLVFGAAPAFQWSRFSLVGALNEGSAQAAGGFRLPRSNRARAGLASAQLALAVVLLVGAGLLLRSFVGLVTVDRGYDSTNVITARTGNPEARRGGGGVRPGDGDGEADARFRAALLEAMTRLERLPGVEAFGVSSRLPLAAARTGTTSTVRVAGRPEPVDPRDRLWASIAWASPGYFDAMRLRLLGGRLFTDLDRAGSPGVVVVNETLARHLSGDGEAVGQLVRLAFENVGDGDDQWREVIGVVADLQYAGLAVSEQQAEAFLPADQTAAARSMFVAVRTIGDPLTLIPVLEEAVVEAHPRATIDDVMTMDGRLSLAVAQSRFYAFLVGVFAALALVLAASGIYGLVSYTVAQRRREIGIRMALGARRADILGLVVRQGTMLMAAGVVLGLGAAAASSRVLESFLYGVTTDDRLTFVAAPLVLAAVALVACWIPARRATRVDPMEVLRFD